MDFFIQTIYLPIYNLLAFFVDVIPGGDLGFAVIAVTVAVRIIFLPLSLSAARTQYAMKAIQPDLDALKKELKDDPQEQARRMFALYKEKGVKPFSSMLMMLIQIPVLFGLYFVTKDAAAYSIDPGLLYSFIPSPEVMSVLFAGMFSVAGPSLVLAVLAGVTQYLYAMKAIPVPPKKPVGETKMQDEFGRAMAIQVRYLFPFLIAFIAYASGALALYFVATNLFMLVQDLFVKKAQASLVETIGSAAIPGA